MTCQPITPRYPGSNVETLLFKKCTLYVCPTADAPTCETVMVMDNLPTGLEPAQAVPGVQVSLNSIHDEVSDSTGWRIYRPASPDGEAVIRLELPQTGLNGLFYFPRVADETSQITVFQIEDDRRDFVNLIRGVDAQWTPIALRYPLRFQYTPRTVEIVLRGPRAQVWHKNGQILFR